MQDEERKRLARDLHDSVGQLLAAISMNMGTVLSRPLDPVAARAAADNATLVEQITSEIRTISHLLHPPLLDEIGLASALSLYVEGFSERSKIAVDLAVAGDFGRLGDDMEIAIFRSVQECLTNVHRHADSRSAGVSVAQDDGRIRVVVKDAGKGIPLEKQVALNSPGGQLGIGFRGMRERIAQLGGDLKIQSNENGTQVTIVMPLAESSTAAPPGEVA